MGLKCKRPFVDIDRIMEESRVLVPMREIFQYLGAEISWDKENNTISGIKGSTTVTLKIGDDVGYNYLQNMFRTILFGNINNIENN